MSLRRLNLSFGSSLWAANCLCRSELELVDFALVRADVGAWGPSGGRNYERANWPRSHEQGGGGPAESPAQMATAMGARVGAGVGVGVGVEVGAGIGIGALARGYPSCALSGRQLCNQSAGNSHQTKGTLKNRHIRPKVRAEAVEGELMLMAKQLTIYENQLSAGGRSCHRRQRTRRAPRINDAMQWLPLSWPVYRRASVNRANISLIGVRQASKMIPPL